jgi:hypothetical protein
MPIKAADTVNEHRFTVGKKENQLLKELIKQKKAETLRTNIDSGVKVAWVGVGVGSAYALYRGLKWVGAGLADVELIDLPGGDWFDRRVNAGTAAQKEYGFWQGLGGYVFGTDEKYTDDDGRVKFKYFWES